MVRATEEREHSIRHVACSPDGRRIAAVWQDGTVRILDAETLTTLSEWAGPAQALAFSPDGSRLATGGHDWTVRLWDVETGEQVLSLSAGASVTTLAFSPDGNVLAAGCVPKTGRRSAPIRIWRVR